MSSLRVHTSAKQANGCRALRWSLVIPVRHAATAKTRLVDVTAALARAIALDTIVAASRTPSVAAITVVTDDDTLERALRPLVNAEECALQVVMQGTVQGLNPSIRLGIQAALAEAALAEAAVAEGINSQGFAVMLGDLPALRSADLERALAECARHPRAAIADHLNTGTTLITARPDELLEPLFGGDSFARHTDAGFVAVELGADSNGAVSTVRADVDTRQDLERARVLGLGAHTSAALAETTHLYAALQPERNVITARDVR